jgi:hypothetical protein
VLTAEFTPNDPNYTGTAETVGIEVSSPASVLRFRGFFKPMKNPPMYNRMRAGQAIPVRFTVDGYRGTASVLKNGSPTSSPISCKAVRTENVVDETEPAIRSGLRQDGARSKFKYTWKTDPKWAGSCRKLVLTLVDGSSHEALFRFPGKPEHVRDIENNSERGKVKPRDKDKHGKDQDKK